LTTVVVYVNDSFGNENSSSVVFTIDSVEPVLTVVSPANYTNTTNNTLDVEYSVVDANLDSCWWSNDSGVTNNSLSGCANITTVTWNEGTTTVLIWTNDTFGNEAGNSVVFSVDSIVPFVSVLSPANNTNTIDSGIDVEYDVSDVNLDSCWYTNDSGITNVSLGGCSNITTVTWNEGTTTVIVYVNDTFGNENSSSVVFAIDSIAPDLSIVSPVNGTSSSDDGLDVNYSVGADAVACWWSNDSGVTNTTLPGCWNVTSVVWPQGMQTVIVWANDSAGNENSSSVVFLVDSIAPAVFIISPTNDTKTTDDQIYIEYSASDANLDSCWWSNDSGATNVSLAGCVNITTIDWEQGGQTVTVYVNDSAGNENSSSIVFAVDSITPSLSVLTPTNGEYFTYTQIDVNYSASDANLDSCWWSNDSGTINTTLVGCSNITGLSWAQGVHNVNIWINDTFGLLRKESIVFYVDSVLPVVGIVSPANGSTSANTGLDVRYNLIDDNLDSCWWSNDSGVTNISLPGCVNITSVNWSEDNHTVIIWANDSFGNENYSSVSFTIDTSGPLVAILTPGDGDDLTYDDVDVNYSVSNEEACWWSNDSGVTNVSLVGCSNITGLTWTQGSHSVIVYANDSVGNEAWDSVDGDCLC